MQLDLSPDEVVLLEGGIPAVLWPSILDIKNQALDQGLTEQEIEMKIGLAAQDLSLATARPLVGYDKPPYRAQKMGDDWSTVLNVEGFNALSFPDSGAKFVGHDAAELIAKKWNGTPGL